MEMDYKVVLVCTQEQLQQLSQEYDVRSVTPVNTETDVESEAEDMEEEEEVDNMEDGESGDEEEDEVFPNKHRANVEGYERCESCFAQPCVTNEDLNEQDWWVGNPEEKSEENSGKRKWKYRKFCSSMRSMGLWKVEEYLAKKTQLMALDGITAGQTKREVMPDCVTSLVRTWLPNPDHKPYVGHTWINQCLVVA